MLEFAAGLLGIPPPPAIRVEDAGLSPMGLEFYSECKRLATGRARSELGFRPQFPSYREGLAAVLAEESPPDSSDPA